MSDGLYGLFKESVLTHPSALEYLGRSLKFSSEPPELPEDFPPYLLDPELKSPAFPRTLRGRKSSQSIGERGRQTEEPGELVGALAGRREVYSYTAVVAREGSEEWYSHEPSEVPGAIVWATGPERWIGGIVAGRSLEGVGHRPLYPVSKEAIREFPPIRLAHSSPRQAYKVLGSILLIVGGESVQESTAYLEAIEVETTTLPERVMARPLPFTDAVYIVAKAAIARYRSAVEPSQGKGKRLRDYQVDDLLYRLRKLQTHSQETLRARQASRFTPQAEESGHANRQLQEFEYLIRQGYETLAKHYRLEPAESRTATEPYWGAIGALEVAYKEASRENWDGYGASPVSGASYDRAKRFLRTLPSTLPPPEVAIDPDGEISFEWRGGSRQVFSVSVGPRGELNYAGLFGTSKAHGVEYLEDKLPETIVDNLRRLFSQETEAATSNRPTG